MRSSVTSLPTPEGPVSTTRSAGVGRLTYLSISGTNVYEAVEQVVSTLDANDLEDARKEHAAFKKYKEAHP